MEYTSGNFLCETIVPSGELIVSRTDLKGIITYANDTFAEISGYEVDELIGKAHNIVRHPDMPKSIFKELWQDLQTKGSWSGVVKNKRKDIKTDKNRLKLCLSYNIFVKSALRPLIRTNFLSN